MNLLSILPIPFQPFALILRLLKMTLFQELHGIVMLLLVYLQNHSAIQSKDILKNQPNFIISVFDIFCLHIYGKHKQRR